ncbi:uncharacterized protein LOC110109688 [Dendrobium catenatum]|uniref:uncharacterized protein LOC110109688 n=1 Tax=Dendrobium catenatum TaxID=906689 RepID=UPI0009F369B4|nr:uncharacterized protein LOC110109688 [Dendrobium catenatum]
MPASGPTNSSPLNPPSNDGLSELLDSMTNSELFSFMTVRRSEFSRIAAILKEREESAKAEALKDLSVTVAKLQDKNNSLEKELLALRNNQAEIQKNQIQMHNSLNCEIMKLGMKKKDCVRLKGEVENLKKDCTALRESEKLAQEKINDLMEEVQRAREESASRRAEDELNALKHKYLEIVQKETDLTCDLIRYSAYCSSLKERFTSLKRAYSALEVSVKNTNKRSKLLEEVQLKLEEARNGRIVEFDSWKDKYSPIETWIQQFLDNNSHLVEKVKEQTTTKEAKCEILYKQLELQEEEVFSGFKHLEKLLTPIEEHRKCFKGSLMCK